MIIFSAIIAWYLPFELFLFSYAVLGPLHYFTEISWLHDRNYFCQSKVQAIPLYLIAVLNFVFVFILEQPINALLLIGFCLAFLSTITKSSHYYLAASLIFIPLGYWLIQFDSISLIFVTLLPTVIHVCVFTFLFMLYGSLKNNSVSGYVSVMILVLTIILLLIIPETGKQQTDQSTLNIIKPFASLANQIILLMERNVNRDSLLASFRFLAFIYTFHYLNWFIKVKAIGWHYISNKRKTLIFFGWITSLGLYYYDFRIGLITLFLFSITHVILEFPLNFISIRGIGQELFIKNKSK